MCDSRWQGWPWFVVIELNSIVAVLQAPLCSQHELGYYWPKLSDLTNIDVIIISSACGGKGSDFSSNESFCHRAVPQEVILRERLGWGLDDVGAE